MQDHWVESRTIFQVEDASNGFWVAAICRESVNRFRWDAHQMSGSKQFYGFM